MKRKIHKIWGVGLTIVIAASLILWTAPVSAGTLSWDTETIPSDSGKVIQPLTDVADLAVAGDGTTIYAAARADILGADPASASTATWSTTEFSTGPSSVLLDFVDGHTYVDFVPASGTTLAALNPPSVGEFGFEYQLSALQGPQLELKFTDPDSSAFVDVTFMLQGLADPDGWKTVDIFTTDFGNVGIWNGSNIGADGQTLDEGLVALS